MITDQTRNSDKALLETLLQQGVGGAQDVSDGVAVCRECAGMQDKNGLNTASWRQPHWGLCYKNQEEIPDVLSLSEGS